VRILVTGSRDWTNGKMIQTALLRAMLEHGARTRAEVTVVHGACPSGADAIADSMAKAMGIQVERYPADWERYGRRAGFIRNDEMVKLGADVCLAFIKDESKGATMCSRLAEDSGIRTVRYVE
jgi:hypothetical protein